MPTYEYECKNCSHTFETFQSMTAKSLRKCPECGKMKLQRLIGAGAGLIFKGSGFYITDYRSDSYKAGAKGDGGGTSNGTGSSETKTDSKASSKAPKSSSTKGTGKSE